LPRGTGMRRPLSPSPALPGSAVYIQSVAGFSCIAAGAIGSDDISGGRSPASINATLHWGSSDRREAITAPAEPPPTTIKSNSSAISSPCLYLTDVLWVAGPPGAMFRLGKVDRDRTRRAPTGRTSVSTVGAPP